jgi:hypothetical protein
MRLGLNNMLLNSIVSSLRGIGLLRVVTLDCLADLSGGGVYATTSNSTKQIPQIGNYFELTV